MANVYIVNHTVGGYYTQNHSYFLPTEREGHEIYHKCMDSVGDDPTVIELIRLDTETLDAVTLDSWEGTIDDLDELPDDPADDTGTDATA